MQHTTTPCQISSQSISDGSICAIRKSPKVCSLPNLLCDDLQTFPMFCSLLHSESLLSSDRRWVALRSFPDTRDQSIMSQYKPKLDLGTEILQAPKLSFEFGEQLDTFETSFQLWACLDRQICRIHYAICGQTQVGNDPHNVKYIYICIYFLNLYRFGGLLERFETTLKLFDGQVTTLTMWINYRAYVCE